MRLERDHHGCAIAGYLQFLEIGVQSSRNGLSLCVFLALPPHFSVLLRENGGYTLIRIRWNGVRTFRRQTWQAGLRD
jgi:hypothetical protein